MLNDHQIEAKWTEIKGGVRNLWGKITEEDLESIHGNLRAISTIVEEKYGESKDTIKNKLEKLMNSFDNDTDKGVTPDESSFERNPTKIRTAEKSQTQDLNREPKTRSPERKKFDEQMLQEKEDHEQTRH